MPKFMRKKRRVKFTLGAMLTGLALCMAASSAMARHTTYLDLAVTGPARPGYPITLTATLSGGPFTLADPRFYGRGLITLYDGADAIASFEPTPANSPNPYTWQDTIYGTDGITPGGIWLLSKLTVVSTNYTLPASLSPRNFVAEFDRRGDDFAKSSTSPTITIQPRNPSIAPALAMLLD